MVIPLEGRRRWLFPASLILLTGAYFLLAAKEFAASHFAGRPDLLSLERAARLSPGNAEYRHRVGRYFAFVVSDPQSALENLQAAVRINPHQARYWFDLAGAYQVAGNSAGQRDALEHALQADPTAPNVAWEAANFFLVEGDVDRALREFRVVIENDPALAGIALQSCWRVRPDIDALLRDAIPPHPDSLIAFLSLLQSKQETDGATKVWDRLAGLHEKFDTRILFDYIRYLILARRPDVAMAAWEKSADTLGLSAYLPSPDNLIVNGDFSLAMLNGGFDWNYQTQSGVGLLLDPGNFRAGQRSLSVSFEGPGIADAGIRQFIPVGGGRNYDFSAYYKSAEFQGAGGPEIVLRDAYTGQILFASDPLNDSAVWKEVHKEFTTPYSTTMLVLNIERVPAGSPIRGKLWLDNFQLTPAAPQEHP